MNQTLQWLAETVGFSTKECDAEPAMTELHHNPAFRSYNDSEQMTESDTSITFKMGIPHPCHRLKELLYGMHPQQFLMHRILTDKEVLL